MVEDSARIERLLNEIATLRNQVAQVQSLRHAEAGVMEYLRTQTEAVDRDCIYGVRRGLLLKALGRLVQAGQVIRIGTGQRGDRYRYQVAACGNEGTEPVEHRTETQEPHFWKSVKTNLTGKHVAPTVLGGGT